LQKARNLAERWRELKFPNWKDGLSPVKPSATAMGFLHLTPVRLFEVLFNTKLLSVLRSRRIKLGLISNAHAMEIAEWTSSPFASWFDSTIFSCEVGLVKPQPEIFPLCLTHMGVRPQQCLFIGDGRSNELLTARRLGFVTVMVAGIVRELC
jgi:HAD superfamily hydrolase (TIGR01509 family)